jgi:hypothetical protein
MKRHYRQGDVLLVEASPDIVTFDHEEVPRENGFVVLAYGEVTGHSHRIASPTACLLRAEGVSDQVLTLHTGAKLVHDEHAPIDLPPGTYIVRRQYEYEPAAPPRIVED